jgi:hypothetical protein
MIAKQVQNIFRVAGRSWLLLLLFVSCCLGAKAQTEFETWGKISDEERILKECSFDIEADAVVLIDEAETIHTEEHEFITYRHIRIKILKEKGIDEANISIPYYAKDERESVDDIQGFAFNIDASGNRVTLSLEKKSIFTEQSNQLWHRKKFTFPGVRAGSIVEYKYKVTQKGYYYLDDWDFQTELPVVVSKYNLSIPPNSEFAYMVHKSDQLQVTVKPDARNGQIYFEMNNVPGLRDEPYMDARRDYLQRVTFQLSAYNNTGFSRQKYMTSWDEVTKELMTNPSFGSQIGKDLSGTDGFINDMKALSSPKEKMRRVYNYVRNYMGWNNIYGFSTMEGVKTAWSKKSGNVADVNMILLNLLKEAGLEAYPLLVSERPHGKVSVQYPFVDQFNAMYAVVVINDKKYYLDATDQFAQPEMVPLTVLNTTGFIVNRKNGGIITIADESLQYKESIVNTLQIGADNTIKGVAFLTSLNYARLQRLRSYKRNSEKYMESLCKSGPSIVIDSFSLKNQEVDSLPLQQYIQFKGKATATGDYIFVPVNLFSGFETNPFIATRRFSDINFGYGQEVNFNTYVDVPEGYAPDVLPKSIKLVNADKTVTFVREIFYDAGANKVLARISVQLKKSLYGVDEYEELKEFYKKMFDLLNEQIVFKKK